ncbi:MAG: hypothetical protein HY554_04660 [Elusimicrobia bacterium]|nr:hypothetical protein [Elusimicrobiota bacterium]
MRRRLATPADAAALRRLAPDLGEAGALEEELARPDRLWALAEEGGEARAFAALHLEPDLRLGKVQRLGAEGAADSPGRRSAAAALLSFVLDAVREAGRLDVVYSTTRNLTLEEQAATLDCGFHLLGVFPNAVSADRHRLNGLSAWYPPGLLEGRRHGAFALHPAVAPIFELARAQCGLPALPPAQAPELPYAGAPVPELELIEAPRFAAERFARLRERKSLSVNFYPFQEPNALITSPDQSVEVFATVSRERRFASLIGERLTVAVDPVALYRRVTDMLHERGLEYLEIINDAADALGIECLVRAGFSPCGYFPCLKQAGDARRDYVIFARSFEPFRYEPLAVDPRYRELFLAYRRAGDAQPVRR